MIVAAADGDWLSRVAALTGVPPEVLDAWIPGILVTGLLLSALYLLVMFATRWGEKNPAAKTMVFSVMAHALLLLSWEFLVPEQPEWQRRAEEEEPQFREVVVTSDERIDLRQSGNTPAWEKAPPPVDAVPERQDRVPLELLPPDAPERTEQAPAEPTAVAAVDVPTNANEPIATPKPEQQGIEGAMAEAAAPLDMPLPQPIDSPREPGSAPVPVREAVAQRDRAEPTITREVSRGTAERVERDVNPIREVASLPLPSHPESLIQRGPVGDELVTRAAPAPVEMPEEVGGTSGPEVGDGSSVGSPAPFTPTRLGSRENGAAGGGDVERLRPEGTPGTAGGADEGRLATTEGVRGPISVRTSNVPSVIRPGGETVRRPAETDVPTIYRARDEELRKETALRHGGSEETERAVAEALRWLAAHQHPDGYWDADAHGAGRANDKDLKDAGKTADAGVTALALLAFLGAGQTHEKGDYTETVERGLRWLVSRQDEEGFLARGASQYERMYCHGMAAYALAEAYGMQEDRTSSLSLRGPVQDAVGYLVSVQNSDGGWRYDREAFPVSDMSMFGWQVLALKRAETAGIPIPAAVEQRMIKFLIDRSLGANKGLAAYYPNQQVTPSMTAEALYCKQRFGIRRDNPASREAVDYLLQHLPRISESNFYYWYYGALAMFEHGGNVAPARGGNDSPEQTAAARRRQQDWRAWNEAMTDALLPTQARAGDDAGSWAPNDRWGGHGGRVYSTALAAMCLEVYYRAGGSEAGDVASRR